MVDTVKCGRCGSQAEVQADDCDGDVSEIPVGWTAMTTLTHSHPVQALRLLACDRCVGPNDHPALFLCDCGAWADYSRGIVGVVCTCPIPIPLAGASEGSLVPW